MNANDNDEKFFDYFNIKRNENLSFSLCGSLSLFVSASIRTESIRWDYSFHNSNEMKHTKKSEKKKTNTRWLAHQKRPTDKIGILLEVQSVMNLLFYRLLLRRKQIQSLFLLMLTLFPLSLKSLILKQHHWCYRMNRQAFRQTDRQAHTHVQLNKKPTHIALMPAGCFNYVLMFDLDENEERVSMTSKIENDWKIW